MAGKVRFPLEMANGILVRKLEELQEHFDIHKVVGHYLSRKLAQWLEGRYDEEANAVAELDRDAPDFIHRLAAIFGVTIEADVEIDISAIQTRNVRIAELRQSTHYVPDVEKNEDYIAFDQAELDSLLNRGVILVYLYGDSFTIPLEKENATYIGIGNPVVNFSTEETVDFAAKVIEFKGVSFCENYLKLLEKAEAKVEESTPSKAHNTDVTDKNNDLFHMTIKDAFYDKGNETIVSGVIHSGSIEVGDKVKVMLTHGETGTVEADVIGVKKFPPEVTQKKGYNIWITLRYFGVYIPGTFSTFSPSVIKRGSVISKSATITEEDANVSVNNPIQ